MSRYLDPKADVVFKKIFGEHPHLLKSFLNAMLPLADDGQIKSLEYLSPEQVPSIPTFKRTIVDVKCTDQNGRIFIVEMQMDWTAGFMQRMLFNAAHAYVKQLWKSEDYQSLCPVYGLGIVNAIFQRKSRNWYHHYQIINAQTPPHRLEGLELIFLELPKFKPSTKSEKILRILWLRFLSELGEKTREISAELLEIEEIKEACALSEEAAYTPGELEAYHDYWDAVRTEKTRITGAEAKGLKKGKAIGLEEGKAIGLEEGKAIGKFEEKIEMAKELIALDMSPEQIARVTKLSLAEIEILMQSKNYILL